MKIGANIIVIHNIDTSDGLTNGQFGKLIAIVKIKDGKVDEFIVKLQKTDTGMKNRRKHTGLTAKYPDSVVIE